MDEEEKKLTKNSTDYNEIQKAIIKLLVDAEYPMSTEEIAEKINYTVNTVRPEIGLMLNNHELIQELRMDRDKRYRKYYINPSNRKKLEGIIHITDQKYDEIQHKSLLFSTQSVHISSDKSAETLKKSSALFEEVKDLKKEIISLMGIFTALFSLITVNIDFFKDLSLKDNSNIIEGFLLVNAIILVAIFAMMWMIKHFLFSSNDNKKEN